MGIAGFFLWLQRNYQECIEDIPLAIVDHILKEIEKEKADRISRLKGGGGGPNHVSRSNENPPHATQSDEPLVPKKTKKRAREKAAREEREVQEWLEKTRADNFYVDMNGLIHPCCHDTHPLPEPETEEEMLDRLFDQLDVLVRVVRPQKCLVLCIDGVAPRSKMNQQRSRRFRAAEERQESDAIAAECADEVVSMFNVPRPRVRERWDSNVITPSTAFMERVAVALKWFVKKKINEDPLWRDLTVVFSDAHVPGEGEHKIMQFIRGLRSSPGYDPRTTHVIHGMDADLICLGLVTHEIHVRILRNQLTETFQPDHSRFTYFNLETYRECLKRDFSDIPGLKFERVLDDFIFLCFFVGNDFLPHVPLISIKTKGIELLLDHYVKGFEEHLYLTKGGEVHFTRLRVFLRSFVKYSFRELKREYQGVMRARDRAKRNVEERVEEATKEIESVGDTIEQLLQEQEDHQAMADDVSAEGASHHDYPALSSSSGPEGSPASPTSPASPVSSELNQVVDLLFGLLTTIRKERSRLVADKEPLTFSYLAANYRRQYYYSKFGWPEAEQEAVKADAAPFERLVSECCAEYFRGMQWVMRYYTVGCPSWEWYYPYHYAPLVEDLAAFSGKVNVEMSLGKPLHPVQQLLAVLPRESVHALPEALHEAVCNRESAFAKFYPDSIDVDYTEANFSYQGVLRIPFVRWEEMRDACESLMQLEEDVGITLVLCHRSSRLASAMMGQLVPYARTEEGEMDVALIEPEVTTATAIAGELGRCDHECPPEKRLVCPDEGLVRAESAYSSPILNNQCQCYIYTGLRVLEYHQNLLLDEEEEAHNAVEAPLEAERQQRYHDSDFPPPAGKNRKRQRERGDDNHGNTKYNTWGHQHQHQHQHQQQPYARTYPPAYQSYHQQYDPPRRGNVYHVDPYAAPVLPSYSSSSSRRGRGHVLGDDAQCYAPPDEQYGHKRHRRETSGYYDDDRRDGGRHSSRHSSRHHSSRHR